MQSVIIIVFIFYNKLLLCKRDNFFMFSLRRSERLFYVLLIAMVICRLDQLSISWKSNYKKVIKRLIFMLSYYYGFSFKNYIAKFSYLNCVLGSL